MNPSLTYELAHDMLARQVFNKFSVEEKNRRKAERVLAANHELDQILQKEGKRRLLSAEEIGYMGPYLGLMDFQVDQQRYLDESIAAVHTAEEKEKAELRRKLQQQRIVFVAVIAAVAGIAYWIQVNNTRLQQQIYDNYMTNAQRLSVVDSLDKAILMYEQAEMEAPNDQGRNSAIQKREETEQKKLQFMAFSHAIYLGDSLFNLQKFNEALGHYQEAQNIGYNTQLIKNKISLTESQRQIAFDKYKKKGLAYFDVQEYRLALNWLERAQRFNRQDGQVLDRIRRCKERIKP